MDDKNTKKNLSTEPYKGVRDFYPEDMFIQKHIFAAMRKAVESFGYVEYNASILEPTELYKAKSGEEIVNEQTYSFKDRGDRDVTLRPEMTPTVTRMVAAKRKELSFPLRWYSIPNLFRYEKPQRGRLREHYQLNVDLFGIEGIQAEIEIISVAHAIMTTLGAKENNFSIKINNRKILNYILEHTFTLAPDSRYKMMKLIDKKAKISVEEFETAAQEIVGKEHIDNFLLLLNTKTIEEFEHVATEKMSTEFQGVKETKEVLAKLAATGISNAEFDLTLARGFDYYTGIVFEVRDTDPANPRSMFGGGRFDDLLSIYGSEKVPAMGFGMGDVTSRDFLETHDLLPSYSSSTTLAICTLSPDVFEFASHMAHDLRKAGITVALNITNRKVGDQIKWADKQKIPYVLCIGENEVSEKKFTIKKLDTKEEKTFSNPEEISTFLKHA